MATNEIYDTVGSMRQTDGFAELKAVVAMYCWFRLHTWRYSFRLVIKENFSSSRYK